MAEKQKQPQTATANQAATTPTATQEQQKAKPKVLQPASWVFLPKKYDSAVGSLALQTVSTDSHPLIQKKIEAPLVNPIVDSPLNSSPIPSKQLHSIDPLAAVGSQQQQQQQQQPPQQLDPLGNPIEQSSKQQSQPTQQPKKIEATISPLVAKQQQQQQQNYDETKDDFFPWAAMKPGILQEYTTDEKIGVTVSFIRQPLQGQMKVPGAAEKDKAAQRMGELEPQTAEEEQRQTLQLTQKEYVRHIEGMHSDMKAAWDSEDRVKTLKVVIQAAKLLGDTSVPVFYPSKFVLVTEILDTFGSMVYERIKQRSSTDRANAAETCRNWFYKIASIRELLPRIYTELSIMRCHSFLAEEPAFGALVEDLSQQVRGISDPLVQAYAYCFLTRKAHDLLPKDREYLLRCLHDTFEYHLALGESRFEKIRKQIGGLLGPSEYMRLYAPAIEWLLHCLSHKVPQSTLEATLAEYRKLSKNALFLNLIISSFPPEFITASALEITKLIREADTTVFPQHMLYRTLGVNLALGNPPFGQELVVLNDVWRIVTKIEDAERYLSISEVWVEYTLRTCKPREVDILSDDIIKHLTVPGVNVIEHQHMQAMLLSIIQKIVSHYESFVTIFSLKSFVRLLDLLSPQTLVDAAKAILESFSRAKDGTQAATDPVVVNALFQIATALHDSVNTLSLSDEIRLASRLICSFVTKIDFGREVERQLNFYSDCRQCFTNLDPVRNALIQCTANLAMRTLSLVHGKHTAKTGAFVRACISFCYVTIPTMEDVWARLNNYLTVAQVALANKCVAQADSFLRAAITLVQEVPSANGSDRTNEELLLSFVSNFLSAAVLCPGHPELGPTYLFQGLLKVLRDFPWSRGSTAKGQIYTRILSSLSALSQQKLLYTTFSDANDSLYRGDPDYIAELQKIVVEVIGLLLEHMTSLKEEPDSVQAQIKLSIETFNVIINFYTLNPQTATLAYNLATLAKQLLSGGASNPSVTSFYTSSIRCLKNKQGKIEQELYKKLASA